MSNNRSYEKGTQDNPYTLEEYNNLYNREEWPGGYVLINDEVLYKGPHMNQDDEEGSGCGCGCGCDEGCGCGCGSDTEEGSHPLTTQYMISSGFESLAISFPPFEELSINWSSGIAMPMSGSSNADGFASIIEIVPVSMISGCILDPSDWTCPGEWIAPYRARFSGKFRYSKLVNGMTLVLDGEIGPIEYTIPEIYHADEGGGC